MDEAESRAVSAKKNLGSSLETRRECRNGNASLLEEYLRIAAQGTEEGDKNGVGQEQTAPEQVLAVNGKCQQDGQQTVVDPLVFKQGGDVAAGQVIHADAESP